MFLILSNYKICYLVFVEKNVKCQDFDLGDGNRWGFFGHGDNET